MGGFAREVRLEPARTGIGDPNNVNTWLKLNVREEVTSGNPGTAASRILPHVIEKYRKEGAEIFNPRTDSEKKGVIKRINEEREKQGKKAISEELFDYNNNKFLQGLDAQMAVMKEDRLRRDPYQEKLKESFLSTEKYHGKKGQAKVRNAIEGSDSIFDIYSKGPSQYLKNKGVVFDSMLRDILPGNKNDFIMAGDMIGSMASFALTRKTPGGAKIPKTLAQEILGRGSGSGVGDAAKIVAGSTAGAASGSLVYDIINGLVRRTFGIANPEDAPTPAVEAMVAGRNAMTFTLGAAGLGVIASAARPFLGEVLFGLKGPAKEMSDIGELYGAPIGINTATEISTTGPLRGAARGYRKTFGKLPFFGGSKMKDKITLSSIQMTKAMKKNIGAYGDDIPLDEVEKFYVDSFKTFPSTIRKKFNKEAEEKGFKSWVDMIKAEARVNELAPIQHMTEIGQFASEKAVARYQRFSYINDMLYTDFETKASSISKAFIPTNNARIVGQALRSTIDDMRIDLRDGNKFEPTLGEIDKFIVDKISNLPDYVNISGIRGLQKEINMLFSEISGPLKKDQGGVALLGSLRKALTSDLNDFARWSKELNPEEKLIAEAAKKSLLRANDVFSKMAPIYKSPVAQQFKLVDQHMFQAGPELPGFIYSDELGKMLFRKGITPQRANDLHDLIGSTAYKSGVNAWITSAFRNSLDQSATVAKEVIMPNGTRQMTNVTEEIFNPDKFIKNLNFDDPGIKRMMDLAGENGEVFKYNVDQLSIIQKELIKQGLGGTTAQMVARRIGLSGLSGVVNMLSMGAAPFAYGGGMAPGVGYTAIMTGLLARKTAAFLSDPHALKSWTRIITPDASVAVQRSAMAVFLKSFLAREDVKSDIPKEFHHLKGVMKNPGKFIDWLYGSGYEGVMQTINDGSKRSYLNERYGPNTDLNYADVAQFQQDDDEFNRIIGNIDPDLPEAFQPPIPPSEIKQTVSLEGDDMQGESIFSEEDTPEMASIPQSQTSSAPLNPNQRVALAGGNLDEAIALGRRT